jgi:DNA-binding helix-turn-helix protein|nr:MAG TPA: putative transcriptional regulator [Caudoviricetes sp.]
MKAVAKRIKAERERQGLSIADLAKTLSVSEKDVLDLENGEVQLQ